MQVDSAHESCEILSTCSGQASLQTQNQEDEKIRGNFGNFRWQGVLPNPTPHPPNKNRHHLIQKTARSSEISHGAVNPQTSPKPLFLSAFQGFYGFSASKPWLNDPGPPPIFGRRHVLCTSQVKGSAMYSHLLTKIRMMIKQFKYLPWLNLQSLTEKSMAGLGRTPNLPPKWCWTKINFMSWCH